MTRVIKVGGAALADAGWLDAFARSAAAMSEPAIIVHGGGPEISALSGRLGIEPEWHEGKRVTPPAALDAAAMVLNGRINTRIVSALVVAGVDAMGVSGADGGLLRAAVAHDGALGLVGRITAVRAELLEWLLGRGITPVISPISMAADGGALNVNADEVASAVAASIGATELLFLTDVEGVLDAGVTRSALSVEDSAAMIASGAAHGGMAVKLNAAAAAAQAGIGRVRIGGLGSLTDAAAGTMVHALVEAAA